MTLYCIDKLILDMNQNMADIKKDIIKWKYSFCNDFEKSLNIDVSEYSQSVFDYIFNLFFFKKAFKEEDLNKNISDLRDLDYNKPKQVSSYFSEKYLEFIFKYKQHFMDYFGFLHEDPLYIQTKMEKNKKDIIEKMRNYY